MLVLSNWVYILKLTNYFIKIKKWMNKTVKY